MAKREHISILNISIFAFYNREVSKSQKNMETFSLFEVGMAKWVNIVAFRDLLAQRKGALTETKNGFLKC